MKRTLGTIWSLCLLTILAIALPQIGFSQTVQAPTDQDIHLAMAHAKWGIIEVILDELENPKFRGDNGYRAAISYYCRHVSTIAAPSLNRWVIRPEKAFLGKDVERSLDRIHQSLEGFDMAIGFNNTPDLALWRAGAAKLEGHIRSGVKEAKAIFKALPKPQVRIPAEFQREALRDEMHIIGAFLVNQDESHRWTPREPGQSGPRTEEVTRVATLHAQALHIAAAMIEHLLANRSGLPAEVQRKLVAVHQDLTSAVEISMRVIKKGNFNWEAFHNRVHQVIDKANSDVFSARMAF